MAKIDEDTIDMVIKNTILKFECKGAFSCLDKKFIVIP